MKQPYNTALYYRLSRDDENFGDSVSIETQRTILQQFARDNQFHVVEEYIDDGWSGTNFDRPAFQRMMDDVEEGRINCIITKDLSRFGREHVMMDYYLEFVFPEKKIREFPAAHFLRPGGLFGRRRENIADLAHSLAPGTGRNV